jgi:integrase
MGLWKDKIRGDWRYDFVCQKKRCAGGGFKTKTEAKAAQGERRKKVKAEETIQAQTPPTAMGLLDLVNKYLDWSQRRHAPGNVANKKVIFRKLAAFLGITAEKDFPIRDFTPALLSEFLATTPSQNSYNNYRKEISTLFSWIQKLHFPDLLNPCAKIEKMPNTTPEKKIPAKEEFLKLLAACTPDERPLIVILIHTLARIDEILRLTWQDVNFEKNTITLWTRKNRAGEWKSRTLGTNRALTAMLLSMWKRRKQEKWVFYNAREKDRYFRRPKLMRSLCVRAGVPNYGFHAIRHFVATYLHDVMKVPTGVLSGILGHENKRTTEIYLHSVDEAQREALGRLDELFEGMDRTQA